MIRICQEVMLRPFVWGKNDCVVAAADVFFDEFGVDPIAGYRGRWKTRREADRFIEDIGGWHAGFPAMFEGNGLVRGGGLGAIGITKEPSEGLAICAAPGLWLGKALRGMAVCPAKHVWRSWCLR